MAMTDLHGSDPENSYHYQLYSAKHDFKYELISLEALETIGLLTCFTFACRLETAPIDVDYRLMELAAGGPTRADPAFLATLLAPLAISPDPLDYLFPWMLLQSLQAMGALRDSASADEVCSHVTSWLILSGDCICGAALLLSLRALFHTYLVLDIDIEQYQHPELVPFLCECLLLTTGAC